ncbi:MAG: hypothetical protein AAFR17_16945 [Pseudomonadota bacterium]
MDKNLPSRAGCARNRRPVSACIIRRELSAPLCPAPQKIVASNRIRSPLNAITVWMRGSWQPSGPLQARPQKLRATTGTQQSTEKCLRALPFQMAALAAREEHAQGHAKILLGAMSLSL